MSFETEPGYEQTNGPTLMGFVHHRESRQPRRVPTNTTPLGVQNNCQKQIKHIMSFFANNLFVYIEKDINSLFSIQSIMNKINFLKRVVPNFFK